MEKPNNPAVPPVRPQGSRPPVPQAQLPPREMALRHFAYEHLRHPELREISRQIHDLAVAMYEQLGSGAEKSAGMRKLVEAKDCFVRQAVDDHGIH